MKRKLYNFHKLIWLIMTIIALKINSHKLFAIILFFNIKRLKNIECKNKDIKKILVFSKSGGIEDIKQALNSKKNNIQVFFIPRSFLKKVHSYFFKSIEKKDYFTKLNNNDEIFKKNSFVDFLTHSFKYLDKIFKINAFVSFNLFYYSEKYFEEVCKNLNKKFIILQKESALTPNEEKEYADVYRKYNNKSLSSKISVYSQSQKKILVKSRIGTENQIVVNGCPRSDFSFKLRKEKPKNKTIVFFLIQTKRYSFTKSSQNLDWKKLYSQTLNYLNDYIKLNPNVTLILKGKTGVHKKKFLSKYLNKNCFYIDGGTGEKFLRDAKVVVAFNSTIVFESIASHRNLIIPNFNNENISKKNDMHQIKNKKHYISSKKQLFKKLDFYLSDSHIIKKLKNDDKLTLNYYLGNIDGKSGERMRKFLFKEIN